MQPAPLIGETRVPGDKSVTQRALLLGALAEGTTRATGALRAGDTLSTVRVAEALGARVRWEGDDAPGSAGGAATGDGVGRAPEHRATLLIEGAPLPAVSDAPLDCGNAGTTARLLLGLLAGRSGRWTLDGDASLRGRPMARVTAPLRAAGADIRGDDPDRLPLTVTGTPLPSWTHAVALPSAQVKSALLLSGLAAEGPVTVAQHTPTRDHTERLLPRFGARVEVQPGRATVWPGPLRGADLDVPGDPSSAAFLIVAALLVPGSEVWLRDVGLWPRRTGAFAALERAGADLMVLQRGRGAAAAPGHDAATRPAPDAADDPRGDIRAAASALRAFDIAPHDVPDLVDEIPILALAAARATGTSRFAGLFELRIKESDRVSGIAALLGALGVPVEVTDDELAITGVEALRPLPADLADRVDLSDHRLALAAAVAAAVTGAALDVPASAAVSFPGFASLLAGLRA